MSENKMNYAMMEASKKFYTMTRNGQNLDEGWGKKDQVEIWLH